MFKGTLLVCEGENGVKINLMNSLVSAKLYKLSSFNKLVTKKIPLHKRNKSRLFSGKILNVWQLNL